MPSMAAFKSQKFSFELQLQSFKETKCITVFTSLCPVEEDTQDDDEGVVAVA